MLLPGGGRAGSWTNLLNWFEHFKVRFYLQAGPQLPLLSQTNLSRIQDFLYVSTTTLLEPTDGKVESLQLLWFGNVELILRS